MKYLWMVMIGLVYIIWTVSAIKDIVRCHRQANFASLEDSTCAWVVTTLLILFAWSFCLWII